MGKEITSQDAMRNDIAYNLFVDTADQNYIVARWCYLNGLYLDFLWNGAHALEKFMKAALLLNGRSAIKPGTGGKAFGHDLDRLYAELSTFADDLLPSSLDQPDGVDVHWIDETAEKFVARMSAGGDPHNRYQIFGFGLRHDDLYKFDKIVFTVRRLCCPLDKYLFGSTRDGQPSITHQDILTKQPEYMPHVVGSRFSKLARDGAEQVQAAALTQNFPFAPAHHDHGGIRTGFTALNPVLMRRVIRPAEQGATGKVAAETVELIDWVVANIFLPDGVKEQIRAAKSTLLANLASAP